ncbi:MAG: DUF6600 domain-containing protein [Acidobacteriota bacterium]
MKARSLVLAAIAALVGSAALASAADDLTSLSYISYLERYATLRPGQGGDTLEAVVNMPVLVGDRLDTARGARVEVQLSDGSTLWIDEFTDIDFDAIAYSRDASDPRTTLYLSDEGAIAVEIPESSPVDAAMRLDTPAGTLYLNRPGLYRVELRSGQLHVEAYSGLAELPSGIGSALVRGGQEAWLNRDGDLQRNVLAASTDDFWAWVQERRHPAAGGVTARYVEGEAAARAYTLDSYGDWVYVPTFSSYMWRPRVAAGWLPYSDGRWVWTPVGWTWVAYEPWGWYPFHYGSWYLDASFGWVWSYDAVWGPAWVHWLYTPGYVGWCPRGYYDYWYWHNNHGSGDWPGFRRPGRWSDVTLDFSGRVRLGQVDQRPWTMVPADQFTNSRLGRVRVDPSRFFRDGNTDRLATVRSGPLLTQPPGRDPARVIDPVLSQPGRQNVPDLGPIMRRETGSLSDSRSQPLRPTLTRDLVRDSRPIARPDNAQPGPVAGRTVERRLGRTGTEQPSPRAVDERGATAPGVTSPGRPGSGQVLRERVDARERWTNPPATGRSPATGTVERRTTQNPGSPVSREAPPARLAPAPTTQRQSPAPRTRVERPNSTPARPASPPPPATGRPGTSRSGAYGMSRGVVSGARSVAQPRSYTREPAASRVPRYEVPVRTEVRPVAPRAYSPAPRVSAMRVSPPVRISAPSRGRATAAPRRR